jgi:hypothetical protein
MFTALMIQYLKSIPALSSQIHYRSSSSEIQKSRYFILCGFSMRFECAYSQGNPIKTQPVEAVLVKTVENRKKKEPHLMFREVL